MPTHTNRGHGVQPSRPNARVVGLHRPTRFVGARRLLIPLDHPDIALWAATGAPVMGRLSAAAFEWMNAVRARIQAEADIAAERRSERRKARRSRRQHESPAPRFRPGRINVAGAKGRRGAGFC